MMIQGGMDPPQLMVPLQQVDQLIDPQNGIVYAGHSRSIFPHERFQGNYIHGLVDSVAQTCLSLLR